MYFILDIYILKKINCLHVERTMGGQVSFLTYFLKSAPVPIIRAIVIPIINLNKGDKHMWCKIKYEEEAIEIERDKEKEKFRKVLMPGGVEKLLFWISITFIIPLILPVLPCITYSLTPQYFLLLLPTVYWMFMRMSRLDMNATGYLIAGIAGALGTAIGAYIAMHSEIEKILTALQKMKLQ